MQFMGALSELGVGRSRLKLAGSAFLMVATMLPIHFSLGVARAAEVELRKGVFVEVTSLHRKDLPHNFPFQLIYEGFAILGVSVRNESAANFPIDPQAMEARNHKGKRVKRALPTDITPRIMKYHRGPGLPRRTASVHKYPSQGPLNPSRGHRGYGRQAEIGVRSPRGTVVAGQAQKLRALLEEHEIEPGAVPPGERIEGFFYLKSKQSGKKLSGRLYLTDQAGASAPF